MTITVVEFAVNHTHAAQIANSATMKTANAPMADNQIGVKNGLC